SKERFWHPIKDAIQSRLKKLEQCRVLEFGAGRTGFRSYISDLRDHTIFDVQDVTPVNQEYLQHEADCVHIGPVEMINEKYDIIFSTFVWEHVSNPKATLTHLLQLLNAGGSLFLISPRYDFPLYLSPSLKHASLVKRGLVAMWLLIKRASVTLGGAPQFLIHLDPALFHGPWFRDADAIHWVSLWDLKRICASLRNVKLPACNTLKERFWAKFCLLYVEIKADST
ncbi:class I SAM-dependent methyltransferase, partial [Oligoflexia bacterium]|nr:class I SAM-dependent methyltransferase [Oligoflexia bacterium]